MINMKVKILHIYNYIACALQGMYLITNPGAVLTKYLNQVLGLTFVYK